MRAVGQALVIATLGLACGLLTGFTGVVSAIHCSLSSEPISGSVENALGILFGILILFRIRSARRRARADQRDSEPSGRLPYRDIGLRESLSSFPDDR